MPRFCRNCGSPITETEKFCRSCGFSLISEELQIPDLPTEVNNSRQIHEYENKSQQSKSSKKFCPHCGKPVREGARFCRHCGLALDKAETKQERNPSSRQTETKKQSSRNKSSSLQKTESKKTKKVKAQQPVKAAAKKETLPAQTTLPAAVSSGEFDFGGPMISALPDPNSSITKVLSPIGGIVHSIGSLISGILRIIKKPSALAGIVLLMALWIVLPQLRASDSLIVKILSWLTFSEGGLNRSVFGMMGGILGRGTVGAAVISLYTGGLKNVLQGIEKLFKGSGEKRSILNIILGVIIGIASYLVFVGPFNISKSMTMAGISGALLSLEALGSGSSKLYELALSLTSRADNGKRTAVQGKCESLLIGLSIGFAVAAVLSTSL